MLRVFITWDTNEEFNKARKGIEELENRLEELLKAFNEEYHLGFKFRSGRTDTVIGEKSEAREEELEEFQMLKQNFELRRMDLENEYAKKRLVLQYKLYNAAQKVREEEIARG